MQNENTSFLAEFDKALGTRNICIAGLAFSWLLSIAFLFFAIIGLVPGHLDFAGFSFPKQTATILAEALPLAVNILITACIDCLGFIHTALLRWSLYQENQLQFNSNLRLFTGARKGRPNSRVANAFSACCHILCYTGGSQILVSGRINTISLVFISFGLAGQAFLSTWYLLSSTGKILTWSSNPLNTALVCLHNGMTHHPRRYIVPASPQVHKKGPLAVAPLVRQPTARSVHTDVRHITRLLWSLAFLVICWAVIILAIKIRNTPARDGPPTWRWTEQDTAFEIGGPGWPLQLCNLGAMLLIAAIQAFLTLGLHCAELIVNTTRDEQVWRSAAKFRQAQGGRSASQRPGASLGSNSIKAAFASWQSIALFIVKPITHWLFGLGMLFEAFGSSTYSYYSLVFQCLPLFTLGGCAFLVAACTAWMVRVSPTGPQPATWGHLETLEDLIDDWGMGHQGKLFWGDKGEGTNRARHAGTSDLQDRIGIIRIDSLYSG